MNDEDDRDLLQQTPVVRSGAESRPADPLRQALDHAPLGAVLASRDVGGAILYLNEELTAITGYTLDDIPTVEDWLRRAYPDELYRAQVLANWQIDTDPTRMRRDVVYRVACKDGSVKDVLLRAGPVGDDLMIVTLLDVSERVEAEEERRRLTERAFNAQKLESLGLLAGGIAHDFNNLLVGVLGNAELALLDAPRGSRLAERLEAIGGAARRASELVRQLMAYAGRGSTARVPVDLAALVEEMVPLLDVGLAQKGTLTIERAPRLPLVEADPTQLRQVVMNLITNAAEALGPEGGHILVETSVRKAAAGLPQGAIGEIPAGAEELVVLEVTDTGAGMDAATRARVFDPFFSTKKLGRGLGLAAVLGVVRSHGGAIAIESAKGRGSSIACLFPASSRRGVGDAGEGAAGGRRAFCGEGVVLLVDDEEAVRLTGRLMLESVGFTAVTAASGGEALDLLDRHRGGLRCVLLDLSMPGMDGAETLAALRARDPALPVVLSSGYGEEESLATLASHDAVTFLQKPYTLDDLCEALRAALGG